MKIKIIRLLIIIVVVVLSLVVYAVKQHIFSDLRNSIIAIKNESDRSSSTIGSMSLSKPVISVVAPSASTPPPPSSSETPQLNLMRSLPKRFYGVTLDKSDNLAEVVLSLRYLAYKPIVRLVFDSDMNPSAYAQAVNQIYPVSYIMGEIVDSGEIANYTRQSYHDRVANYLSVFGDKIDLWEVGNEVNGSWTGNYDDVEAKIDDAYNQVKSVGGRTALTLFYNNQCGDGSNELDPIAFSDKYVSTDMRHGLDYVFISYYEPECQNIRPTVIDFTNFFDQLHTLYPKAQLGFGEIGLPEPATTKNLKLAESILTYYYGLKISTPGYVGGYFWWNYVEDMIPYQTKTLWQSLNQAIQSY